MCIFLSHSRIATLPSFGSLCRRDWLRPRARGLARCPHCRIWARSRGTPPGAVGREPGEDSCRAAPRQEPQRALPLSRPAGQDGPRGLEVTLAGRPPQPILPALLQPQPAVARLCAREEGARTMGGRKNSLPRPRAQEQKRSCALGLSEHRTVSWEEGTQDSGSGGLLPKMATRHNDFWFLHLLTRICRKLTLTREGRLRCPAGQPRVIRRLWRQTEA